MRVSVEEAAHGRRACSSRVRRRVEELSPADVKSAASSQSSQTKADTNDRRRTKEIEQKAISSSQSSTHIPLISLPLSLCHASLGLLFRLS